MSVLVCCQNISVRCSQYRPVRMAVFTPKHCSHDYTAFLHKKTENWSGHHRSNWKWSNMAKQCPFFYCQRTHTNTHTIPIVCVCVCVSHFQEQLIIIEIQIDFVWIAFTVGHVLSHWFLKKIIRVNLGGSWQQSAGMNGLTAWCMYPALCHLLMFACWWLWRTRCANKTGFQSSHFCQSNG